MGSLEGTRDDTILTLPHGIVVRRMREEDAASLSHHANNDKVWANLRDRIPRPYLESDALNWIRFTVKDVNSVSSGPWDATTGLGTGPKVPVHYAITVQGTAVGCIGLQFGDPKDVYKRTAELGYWIGEAYWGKKIMSAVVPAFVQWAMHTFGTLLRLNGCCFEWNVGSRVLMEKAGFAYEGRREAAAWKNGRVCAEIMLGYVRPDGI